MPRNDDAPAGRASPTDARSADGQTTRRALLQTGLAAGVAATSFGGVASTVGAQSIEEGPEPPENLRTEWHLGGPVGLAWDWPEDRCETDLSRFAVSVEDDDGVRGYELPPEQHAFVLPSYTGEATVSVRAVDEDRGLSDPVEETFLPVAVDVGHLLRPASSPELDAGESATVPIELLSGAEETEPVRYELEVSVRATCVATIEDVSLPDDLGMTLVETELAEDGSSVRIVAEGQVHVDAEEAPWDGTLAEVEVAGQSVGGTVLDVTDEELVFLEDDWTVEEWEQYRAEPAELPDDVGFADLVNEVDAFDRWTTLSVDGSTPAPPENLEVDSWISTTAELTWDWPDGLCADELSHFHVTFHDPPHPVEGELLEERTVRAERPSTRVDPEQLLYGDDSSDELLVSVHAVDQYGSRSEPARQTLLPVIADPGYTLHPGSPSTTVGETDTVSIEFGDVLAEPVGLVRWELDLSVAAPCVATVADVTVPRAEWEILETEWAADDGAVTVVAEGPPPEDRDDYYRQELAEVEIAGHAPGETLLDVSDVELVALDPDYTSAQYEHARYAEEEGIEDPPFTVAEVTQEVGATDTLSTVTVHPPTVVGDSPPQDVDGDGLYRDVTGDGSLTNSDVVEFFGNQHAPVIDDYPDAYDFTGDGEVTQADVVELFESL